jgi:hypothetical protein
MALRKTTVTLVDDLDGSDADETVSFGLEGVEYEIDLTAKNAAALRDSLADYTGAGRRIRNGQSAGARNGRGRVPTVTSSSERQRNTDIRRWCRENNVPCADRGRIAGRVQQAFKENNPELAR